MTAYTTEFFDRHREWSFQSAKQVVPLVTELVQPASVVDVGCGDGTWLQIFMEQGVQDTLGIDGDYVGSASLQIPSNCFVSHDLTKPLLSAVTRTFDLVVSLEVGEHLPADDAEGFVSTLTSLGPIVLFSAAAPNQGGTEHVNEQWPEYWASLFKQHGYVVVDCIRRRIWKDQRVQWWYRQNILLFVRHGHHAKSGALQQEIDNRDDSMLSIIHPDAYDFKQQEVEHWHRAFENPPLRKALASLPAAVGRTVSKRFLRPAQPSP